MTSAEIRNLLSKWGSYHNIFIPEFTWGGLRIDAVMIDTEHRWVRGFEIKANKNDFVRDDKWTMYTGFCSSLSIVCPDGIVKPEEIEKPFGLVYAYGDGQKEALRWLQWVKKPKNFQSRKSLSWLWTYVRILETEFGRMQCEVNDIRLRLVNEGRL